jgi:hypothetical protein
MPSRWRRVGAVAIVAIPALLAVWAIATCALSRGVHEARYGHDIFLPLDGAWRVLRGQTQHVDFYSPYGPIETSLVAWMMRLGGIGSLAIPRAVAIVGVVASVGAIAVAAWRMTPAIGAWLLLVAALVAVGRNQLGFAFYHASHSAYYNRIGFALLACVMVESLVAPRTERRAVVVAGGVLSGFFTALLLFVKLTFPLVAAVFIAAGAVLKPSSRARWIAIGGGAVAGLVAGGALIGFHYGAMLGDYAFIAAARHTFAGSRLGFFADTFARDSPVITPGRIAETMANEAWPTLALAALAAVVPLDAFRIRERRQIAILAVMTWLASLGLVLTSWQWGDSPLFAIVALVLVEHMLRADTVERWRRWTCVALAAACVAGFVGKQLVSVLYDRQWQANYDEQLDTFHGMATARGLVIDGSDSFCRPHDYGPRILEAIDVIQTVPNARVITLDFSNPFPFLMQSEPAHGGGVCWHYDSTFSQEVFLSPPAMFGDANVVVIPKCPEDADAAMALASLYDKTLHREFHLLKETPSFYVLQRND